MSQAAMQPTLGPPNQVSASCGSAISLEAHTKVTGRSCGTGQALLLSYRERFEKFETGGFGSQPKGSAGGVVGYITENTNMPLSPARD
jgi:hypothetical protein